MSEEAQILADAAKLPIDERCAHANWKVRSAAYEQIRASCNSVFDRSDPILSDYVGVFPKACTDGNAAALDKALEALQAFLEKASDSLASRIAGSASSNIVAKALGARSSTMAKGIDCLMGFVEVEQAEKVTSSLLEGCKHKVPKVVLGSLEALLQLVRAFGGRVLPAQQMLKSLGPMFESKDAKAREITKNIVAELARWMGPELIRANLYDKLRDAQKDDVEKLLQEAPAGRPKPERLTRKEAEKAAVAVAPAAADGDGTAAGEAAAAAVAEDEPEQNDSYEFAEPKDIIPELKKDFWDGLAAAKWSERKAALTALKELAAYPRLANGDYADVNRELKKIITKDSNINVVAEAINCTANIAKGLRKDYKGPAMSLCPVLLEKFKDKAAVVTRAAAEALDMMHLYSFALPDVAEDVTAALAHQNPKVKESTGTWLANCTKRETKANVLKLLPAVVPAAVKCTDEGAPAIREAAFSFLVQAALKAGSLAALDKGLSKMHDAKRKKLEEMVQEAAKARRPGAAAAAAGGLPAAAQAPVRASSNRSIRAPASGGPSPVTSPRASNSGQAARPAAGRSSSVRSSSSRLPAGAKPKSAAAGNSAAAAATDGAVEDEASLSGGLLNAHEAKAKLVELFGEELTTALGDVQWKARLEAMEIVVAKAQEPDAAGFASVLAQCMAHVPGFDDKNFQVMAKEFEVIRCCAAHPTFSKREALLAVMGATDKLADLKLKEPAFQMLLAASEAVGPQLVASLLHKRAAAHKNPKVLTETINWINLAVQDFLLPAFNVKSLLDWAKEDLGSANAATRTAATQFLGSLHAFVGPQLAEMVRADLKPATMATVESEFAKNPQQSGWQAKRVCRVAATAKTAAGGGKPKGKAAAAAAASTEDPPSMDDLLPRADISGQISGELVAMLGSANWKERKAALDEVESIIAAAGGRIQPCVGDLMPALKGRMADSNKNLIAQALMLLGKLAKAMGRAIAREARPVLAPAVRCICDSKATVRAAVIEMLDAWVSVAPADLPFEELTEVLPSPKCVSEGMQAGICWMASVYSAGKGTSSDSIACAVKALAIGAGYKTVPVRDAAAQLLEAMLASVGLGEVQRAVQGLDKALQKVAADALTKAGISAAAVAAAPAAVAASTSRPGTAGSSRATVGGSRPGTAGSRAAGSAAASRPGTAGSGVARSVAASSVGSLRSSNAAGMAAAAAASDEGPLLSMDKNKEDRARKARFKSSKFEIRPDEVQTLEAELGALAAPGLRANLFAKDFKKQIQAADAVKNWLMDQPEVLDTCISCLDLLLRWSVVRLAEGNTQTLVGVTGMLKVLFELLVDQGYRLSEAEVKVFLPGLVEKCGQPTPQMKEACRDLIRRVATMHPPGKVVTFLQEGLLSKNNRSRVTCAEEIAYLVDKEGPRVYSGAKCDVLPALAKLTSEQGKEIRAAALGALEVVYAYEGEGVWKRLGHLNGQQQGIIEERLKTMDKDLVKKGLSAGYKKAEYEAARSSQALETGFSDTPASLQAPAAMSSTVGGGRSILDTVQPNAYAAAGGYGIGTNGFAVPNSSQSVLPGLSNSAGLISLRNSSGNVAADSSTFSRQASLLATAEYNAPSQSQLLMSNVPATATYAVDHQAAAPGTQVQQQQQPAAAAQGAGLNLQPLQSFSDPKDLQEEFDKCLGVLQCGHVDDVVEVMKLLCYEMMDLQRHQAVAAAGTPSTNPQAEEVWQLLLRQVDPLVVLLTMQTQQVFVAASVAMRSGQLSAAHCRACKYALNTLMNIFSSSALPVGLRLESLADLVRVLLLRLVDDNLGRMSEGEALLKALNVLMLKILENSNRNYTFSALLSLLLDIPTDMAATGAEAAQQQALAMRWADLVVKCLIKSTKALPQVINTIDLRSLLLSIHGFFETLGVEEIRRRSHADDKPLRMVKTILHELCKLKGTDIYRYTADIPQQGSTSGADGKPVIFPYIDLNIQTLQGNGAIRTAGVQNPITPGRQAAAVGGVGAGGAASTRANAMTPGAALRSQKDSIVVRLSDVFGRLSNLMQTSTKDSSEKRAVLMDIYTISQDQGMPIDKLMAMYLPDTTPAFKSWISGELRKIDEELQSYGQQGSEAAAAAGVDYQRDIPVLDVTVGAGTAGNGSYVAPYRASDSMTPAAGGGADGPGSAGELAASAAGGSSNTMEALKARMSQLQVEKSRIRSAVAAVDSSPGTAAASGGVFVRAAPAPAPPAAETAPAALVAALQVEAAAPAGSGRNLQDLRSRMRGLLS